MKDDGSLYLYIAVSMFIVFIVGILAVPVWIPDDSPLLAKNMGMRDHGAVPGINPLVFAAAIVAFLGATFGFRFAGTLSNFIVDRFGGDGDDEPIDYDRL